MLKSLRSGSGTDDVFIPTWEHYTELSFMAPTVELGETESSIIGPQQEVSAETQSEEAPDLCPLDVSNFISMPIITLLYNSH